MNPGSVGQPRDGDARAAYAIADMDQKIVTLHRVAYAIETAQKKILDAGSAAGACVSTGDGAVG